jgi:hypothetical protein
MAKKKPKSASDFSAELERDPEYQARLARIQAKAEAQGEAAAVDEDALIADLEGAGIRVHSIYDFVNEYATPAEAVPHLVRHLDGHHLPVVREGILRALAYAHLRSTALEPLKRFFVQSQVPRERWLAANALATMASLAELRPDVPGLDEHASLFTGVPRRG